jgi:hypothetical protein
MFLDCNNVRGNTRMVQKDENGFWMVNFQRQFSPMVEPYMFPMHVSQVWLNLCLYITLVNICQITLK